MDLIELISNNSFIKRSLGLCVIQISFISILAIMAVMTNSLRNVLTSSTCSVVNGPPYLLFPKSAIQRCIPSIKIYQKFLLGVGIKIISIILLLVFDITARRNKLEYHGNNMSHCTFYSNQHNMLSSDFNNNWMAITVTVVPDSLAQTLLYMSAFEFIVSQTPYSMRGLIFGAGFGGK